jgi:hypothetical protein
MKYLGGNVFGLFAAGGTTRHVGVDHMKVARIKFGKMSRVALGGFD